MRLKNLLANTFSLEPCVLGLGTFDGVHIGHRRLIAEVRAKAAETGLPSVLLTFDHSPRRLLSREFPGEITTPEEKFNLLLGTGIDWVVFRPFDAKFAMIPPEQFVQEIILDKLRAKQVFVGFNYGFGAKRLGNAKFLQSFLMRHSIPCTVLPPVLHDGKTVSSTLIREAILKGDFATANDLLGRQAAFTGEVVHGDHRGRELGFPTANILLGGSSKVLPPHGVYAGHADTNQGTFPALVNIGIRPTFNRREPLLEAHLAGFSGNLYHQTIRVRFSQRLRDEMRFPSREALVAQMQDDLLVLNDLFSRERETGA